MSPGEDNAANVRWEWQELVENGRWDELRNWIDDPERLSKESGPSLAALLAKLRGMVPMVEVSNGVECTRRRLRPSDPPDMWVGREHLREAAVILELGELEARVEREPPAASTEWAEHREIVRSHLEHFIEADNPTSGDEDLSRRAHAQTALDLFSRIDFSKAIADAQSSSARDQEWLTELVSEIAFAAFAAGRHTQAAWGKEFEPFVPTGMKVQAGQVRGGETRKGQTYERTEQVLEKMDRLIEKGQSISRAAELTFGKGLGTSAEANRKLYTRYRKRSE